MWIILLHSLGNRVDEALGKAAGHRAKKKKLKETRQGSRCELPGKLLCVLEGVTH